MIKVGTTVESVYAVGAAGGQGLSVVKQSQTELNTADRHTSRGRPGARRGIVEFGAFQGRACQVSAACGQDLAVRQQHSREVIAADLQVAGGAPGFSYGVVEFLIITLAPALPLSLCK